MTDWRFVVIQQFGTKDQREWTCKRINSIVERMGVSLQFPLVKYELGRRGEYYLGLAVNVPDADESYIPEVAKQILEGAGVRVGRPIWPVGASGLDKLLRGSINCKSFTIPITYEWIEQTAASLDWSQVIQQIDAESMDHLNVHSNSTENSFDRLLWWCSAVGSGDAARLAQACSCLGIDKAASTTWSIIRRLVLLGHMEYEWGRGLRWAMIEPSVVQRAGMPGEYFLTGQRSPKYLETLGKRVLGNEPQAGAPQRISLHLELGDALPSMFGRAIRSAGCAAESLAVELPTISRWAEMLPVWDERDFGRYQVERYCTDDNTFLPPGPFNGPSEGFYRFKLEGSYYPMTIHAYYSADTALWRCADYYGLRFLARARAMKCEAHWRAPSQELLVPSCDRWPMPYERALVLASGLLPRKLLASPGEFLAYSGVTEQLAQRLFGLLDIEWKVSND